MSQKKSNRATISKIVYWAGVAVLLFLSAFAVYDMCSGGSPFNGYVLTVVLSNIVVFGVRAGYVGCNKDVLFSEANYRAVEQATNAERVALTRLL